MLKTFFFTVLTLGVVTSSQAESTLDYKSAYQCEDKSKFNWYCDDAEVIVEKKEPKAEAPKKETPTEKVETKAPEIEEFAQIQKRLEELMQIAYVNPTKENIYNYIEYQNGVTTKAAVFADTWKRVQWLSPELDYSQKHPTAGMAKAVKNKVVKEKKAYNLEHLKAEGYGIFFFYKSTCEYCHQMRYPLDLLVKRTGMDVMSISMDGVLLDKFPNSVADTGQAENLGVVQTPTLMLVNTKTKDIQPISTGWVSLQDLEERIYVLTATKPGDNY
jgi:conjugal transfer pilus assembly protein TraF